MKETKFEKEIRKKQERRVQELKQLEELSIDLHDNPVAPKKPIEFRFDRKDASTFEYPIGIGNHLIEKKSDGYCVHISVDKRSVEPIRIFSSNSNQWNPNCFPELLKDISKLPDGYYHGEMLGKAPNSLYFPSLMEFTAIENRPKLNQNNVTKELIEKYPLKLDIFDALVMERCRLASKPLRERRYTLEHTVEKSDNLGLSLQWLIDDEKDLKDHFIWAVDNGYEGLIAKDPNSLYVPGSRDNDWIKLKNFTTLDLAVLGFYQTEESKKAGKPFSAILVGSYNPKTKEFETVAKVKVGSKKDQDEIYKKVDVVQTSEDYNKVIQSNSHIRFNPAMESIERKIPDRIVTYDPKRLAIVEIQCLDVTYSENWHSCGLSYDNKRSHSLRIATFVKIRDDKRCLEDITTTQQILKYYTG